MTSLLPVADVNRFLVHADVSFGSTVNLSNDSPDSARPRIAVSGSNVYVTWENSTFATLEPDILFRASSNDGSTFGPIINLSANTGSSVGPRIAVSGSVVYVVWQDDTGGDNEILLRVSSNNGASFGSIVALTADTREDIMPDVAASGTNVYVAWQKETSGAGTPEINVRVSTNSGGSFGSAVNLSNNPGSSRSPKIVALAGNVYVAWLDDIDTTQNDEIFFKASINSGSTFGAAVNLSSDAGPSFLHTIAAAGNSVYVAWKDDTNNLLNFDTLIRVSTNNGGSFGSIINLSGTGLADASHPPGMAVSGSNVYVAWGERVSGNDEVFLRASTNNGATFAGKVNVSANSGISTHPRVSASGSNVYVAWEDGTAAAGAGEIFFKSSSNGAASFSPVSNLSSNPGFSIAPELVSTSSNVYLAWQDDTNGNEDVLFRSAGPTIRSVADFTIIALASGWNSTLPPGSVSSCSPSGTPGCNPGLTEFRGLAFTVTVIWLSPEPSHVFAIYTKDFPSGSVSAADICSLSNTNGCLAKSGIVSSTSPSVVFTFTPNIPLDGPPFSGPGGYEYYCQFHPGTMHGKIVVLKNPDLNGDRRVTLVDVASVAFSFGSSYGPPPSPTWDITMDLNNDGAVDISDVATSAFYFGKTV